MTDPLNNCDPPVLSLSVKFNFYPTPDEREVALPITSFLERVEYLSQQRQRSRESAMLGERCPRSFAVEPLPAPLDFPIDSQKNGRRFAEGEAAREANVRMLQRSLLTLELLFLSKLPLDIIDRKFREYCEAHPDKSLEENSKKIREDRTYLDWNPINKNCKFFSGNEGLKCAVNPTVECSECPHFEE